MLVLIESLYTILRYFCAHGSVNLYLIPAGKAWTPWEKILAGVARKHFADVI